MNKISTILAVVAIVLASALYFVQAGQIRELKGHATTEVKPVSGTSFRIAYFDMDSLEAHYEVFKDAQAQVKAKENEMNMDLQRLDRDNQKKIQVWRQKGNQMTQAEGEAAQQEYAQMQQQFASRKQDLEQALYKSTEERKADIRKRIEEFLKEYNKTKNFSYIFAYDPNSFIYNKDSSYNITNELVQGLNDAYKKK
ncbi:MAG TPA: OmpH family outer membrane protein [Puia sp.]|nr:OmpH family outer membrane protein [Puia sp.]